MDSATWSMRHARNANVIAKLCKETKYDEENHPSNSPFANVDPRFLDEYDHWPVEKKVSKMIICNFYLLGIIRDFYF